MTASWAAAARSFGFTTKDSFDRVILEIKAARDLAPEHRAQLINYLRATGVKLGLLVNFGATPKAQIVRVAL